MKPGFGRRFVRTMFALATMALHRSLITFFFTTPHRVPLMLAGISSDLFCLGLITLALEGWKTSKDVQ